MTMKETTRVVVLAALACWAIACSPDDEAETGGRGNDDESSQEAHDKEVCWDEAEDLWATECPIGFLPQFHYGNPEVAVLAEDVAVPICGDNGFLVDFGAFPGAKWLGYEATKNSACAFGCFAGCNVGQMGCFNLRTGAHFCSRDIDVQSCTDFVDIDDEGDACGLESDGDDGGGGSDEATGG